MKKTLIVTAFAVVLSTAVASAQSSQGNVGPGTNQNGAMGNSSNMSGSGMSNSGMNTGSGMTTGSGMSGNSQNLDRNGVSRTPSSQGNVGPGTDNNRTPATR